MNIRTFATLIVAVVPFNAVIGQSFSGYDGDFPDGMAFNLVDGVIRARYREGLEEEKLIEPRRHLQKQRK